MSSRSNPEPDPKPQHVPPIWYHEFQQYDYKGEERIMKMFQQPYIQQGIRGFVPTKVNRPVHSVGNSLTDKARLYTELGFEFNASGYALPEPGKKRQLVYKPRKDANSFLGGILSQDDRLNPIQADGLMWIDRPHSRKRPVIWFIRNDGATLKGLQCVPDLAYVTTEVRKEGLTTLNFWSCTKWYVTPTPPLAEVMSVLELLGKRFSVPANVTVDMFGDQVFDVHAGILVSGLSFDQAHVIELTMGLTKDRPFFDKVVTEMRVTKMQ